MLPLVSPFTQSALRLRLKKVAFRVCSVRARLSRFIQASISTSPVEASWTIAGARPCASHFTSSAFIGAWESRARRRLP